METDDEVLHAYLRLIEAIQSGDASGISSMIADEPGVIFLGTDPEEWWRGAEEVAQAVEAQYEAAPGMKMRTGDVAAYRRGDLGLVADRPTFVMADGTEQAARVTIAFRKDGDDWKVVQAHTSVAVPNQDVAAFESLA
jgi:ketosteroid isomerase-like protein